MATVSSDAATVRSLKNSVNGYYEALDEVCSALLIDQDFDIKLHGFGFDKTGSEYYFSNIESTAHQAHELSSVVCRL